MRCSKWIVIPFELKTTTECYEGYLVNRDYGRKSLKKVIFS